MNWIANKISLLGHDITLEAGRTTASRQAFHSKRHRMMALEPVITTIAGSTSTSCKGVQRKRSSWNLGVVPQPWCCSSKLKQKL